ncbi:MAG: hypothetical protein EAZ44_06835 [Cytophagia bacterium]|nr:MAG: hypothetical protein EAZ44_06835 [Cytophagia bacterium]TAG42212.1 MAG: hypothetical protein EAZ31_06565 [Cytophagia bacterium]
MKRIIIGFIAFLTLSLGYAQTEKGTIYVGGNLRFGSTTNKTTSGTITSESSSSNFSIIPDVGYFISDNVAIGLGIGYSQSTSKSPNGLTTTTTTESNFIIAPTFRYYMPTSSETFKFFLQARVGINTGNVKSETATLTTTDKTNGWDFFVSPNFAYFPTKKWSIEFGVQGIGYSSGSRSNGFNNSTNNSSGFSFDLSSFSPSLGIRAFFGKK